MPTPKRPSRPLATSSIHKMLTNPYYRGVVVYRGARYAGAHEPIVPAEMWYQVQAVLRAHAQAEERTQVHDHYLKGTLFCGQCGSRLIVAHAKNWQGIVYPYFVCAGRHAKRTACERRAIPIDYIEWLIEEHYRTVQLDPDVIDAVRAAVIQDFDQQMAGGNAEPRTVHRPTPGSGGRTRQGCCRRTTPTRSRSTCSRASRTASVRSLRIIDARIDGQKSDYREGRTHLNDCLALLVDCYSLYLNTDDQTRRLFNQAIFERIYLDEAGEFRADYTRPYSGLLDPDVHRQALERAAQGGEGPWPELVQHAPSSNDGRLVPATGLEPAAFCSGGRRSIH